MKGTTTMQATSTASHIPKDTHDLFSNCSPEAKAVYANTYGLIWRDGGKHAATLYILNDYAIALLAVTGTAQTWCDSLGPRPGETDEIALACARMFALLELIREINPKCHTLDWEELSAKRRENGIDELVSAGHAAAAKQIRDAVNGIPRD